MPYIKITGLTPRAAKKESRLEKAFLEFVKEKCTEK
jgi:hypothetical protein